MDQKIKVVLVGRHVSDFGSLDVEVASQENVTFPATAVEVIPVLNQLWNKARELGANAVLLQNTPGQVASALVKMAIEGQIGQGPEDVHFGVIISVPSSAPLAGVSKQFVFTSLDESEPLPWCAGTAEEAVKHANSRAKTEINEGVLTVTVDPVRPFVFDHIEWLS